MTESAVMRWGITDSLWGWVHQLPPYSHCFSHNTSQLWTQIPSPSHTIPWRRRAEIVVSLSLVVEYELYGVRGLTLMKIWPLSADLTSGSLWDEQPLNPHKQISVTTATDTFSCNIAWARKLNHCTTGL